MNNIDSQKLENKLFEARNLILNFKFKEALDILNKYKKDSEDNAYWHCIWGFVFIYKNQIQKAFEYYESIYKKFENNPDFLFYYSQLLYWKRDYKKSIEIAVKGYLIIKNNKFYKNIYQNYFKILSEAPVFSSPIPVVDTLFPGYIPKYNDNSNKDRIKIEKKYKNHKEFRMYIISIMKEYEILSDNFIYFGSSLKNNDLYVYNIDKYDEYKIVFTKGLVDYTLSLMNISTKVF